MSKQTRGKKVVDINIATALGIICILLAVGLVWMFQYYRMGLDFGNRYNEYVTNHHYTDSEYDDLAEIVDLAKSSVWADGITVSQPAGYYTYWNRTAHYAGYIRVHVQSSTTTNTYVRVIYSSFGVEYDDEMLVGVGGTAVFPVLPSSPIQVRVGNTNLVDGAAITVTITYHY